VSDVPIVAAVAFVAAAVLLGAAVSVWRQRCLRRALTRERAAHRLSSARLHRDLDLCQARIDQAALERRLRASVLAEADRVLDAALASHYPDQKGGPVA
jgi:predicted lysophospholipase L1 biosynthesis ABC-type transport system permease subunit